MGVLLVYELIYCLLLQDLDVAQKYYGFYVVLLKTMHRMQNVITIFAFCTFSK